MKVLYTLLLLIGVAFASQAQMETYQGVVSVKQKKTAVVKNKLVLDMDISMIGLSISRYQSLLLMPMLRTAKDSLILPPVVVNGANKQKMYERTLALQGPQAANDGAYSVIKNDPKFIRVISYKMSIPFRPWMANAQLVLIGELGDYEGYPVQTFINVLTKRMNLKAPKVTVPKVEKEYDEDDEY